MKREYKDDLKDDRLTHWLAGGAISVCSMVFERNNIQITDCHGTSPFAEVTSNIEEDLSLIFLSFHYGHWILTTGFGYC